MSATPRRSDPDHGHSSPDIPLAGGPDDAASAGDGTPRADRGAAAGSRTGSRTGSHGSAETGARTGAKAPRPPKRRAPAAPPRRSADPEGDRPEDWLDAHGDILFRYAIGRVGDRTVAEDLVQETLLAGLSARFDGRSTRRTWLIGILRHRILDHMRRRSRRGAEEGLERFVDAMFDGSGKWSDSVGTMPGDTPSPGDLSELRQAIVHCMDRLPPRTAEVFLLVEHDETPVTAVADRLDTTPGNVHVIMHRARLALRSCLEKSGAA